MNINELISKYNLYKITGFKAAGFEQFIHNDPFARYNMTRRGIRVWNKFDADAHFLIEERFRQNRIDYIVIYKINDTNFGIVTNKKLPIDKGLTKRYFSSNDMLSCEDAPAVLRLKKNGKILKAEWWRDATDITTDVEQWITDNEHPALTKWGERHITQLKEDFFSPTTYCNNSNISN